MNSNIVLIEVLLRPFFLKQSSHHMHRGGTFSRHFFYLLLRDVSRDYLISTILIKIRIVPNVVFHL